MTLSGMGTVAVINKHLPLVNAAHNDITIRVPPCDSSAAGTDALTDTVDIPIHIAVVGLGTERAAYRAGLYVRTVFVFIVMADRVTDRTALGAYP